MNGEVAKSYRTFQRESICRGFHSGVVGYPGLLTFREIVPSFSSVGGSKKNGPSQPLKMKATLFRNVGNHAQGHSFTSQKTWIIYRRTRGREDNIKMGLQYLGCGGRKLY